MNLYVLGGKFKGQKLFSPKDSKVTRPTLSICKEAIFNMCHFEIENSFFLDAFSGTGSMAIEAVSRGAEKAYCIENNRNAFKIIKKNISLLSLENQIEPAFGDTKKKLKNVNASFDIIYLDPPYLLYKEGNFIGDFLNFFYLNKLLNPSAIIFFEIPSNILESEIIFDLDLFELVKRKKYGSSSILKFFYKK